jgi:Protein of unknown function (DUF3606)
VVKAESGVEEAGVYRRIVLWIDCNKSATILKELCIKYDKSRELVMELDGSKTARDPREIHELAYWKHLLGVSEYAVLNAMAKVGNDRSKIERELRRLR